jgi:G protein-coupled receptor 107
MRPLATWFPPLSNQVGVKVARSSSIAFHVSELGQYTLIFANCLDDSLKVDMDVRSIIYNIDSSIRERQCLSVLPSFYFLFYLPYA